MRDRRNAKVMAVAMNSAIRLLVNSPGQWSIPSLSSTERLKLVSLIKDLNMELNLAEDTIAPLHRFNKPGYRVHNGKHRILVDLVDLPRPSGNLDEEYHAVRVVWITQRREQLSVFWNGTCEGGDVCIIVDASAQPKLAGTTTWAWGQGGAFNQGKHHL